MALGVQRRIVYLLMAAIALAALLAVGCDDEESGGQGAAGTGTLQVLMTDAATDQYSAVYVTVDRVEVNRSDDEGWIVVGTPGKTSNLLDLVNGVTEELGMAELDSGSYAQVRLLLGTVPDDGTNIDGQNHPYANYLILPDGSVRELKVPSGLQSGIKIVGGFEVVGGDLVTLLLDFDASRSVVQTSDNRPWQLRPTITVHEVSQSAQVTGMVKSEDFATDQIAPLAGARVSAQNVAGADPVAVAATVTGDGAEGVNTPAGGYTLDVAPGEYAIVASKSGYRTHCQLVNVAAGSQSVPDLVLPLLSSVPGWGTGTVTGVVNDPAAPQDAIVRISVQAGFDCGAGGNTIVEVAQRQVLNGSTYSLTLPNGDFVLKAWSDYHTTPDVNTVLIVANTTITTNFNFAE